MNIRFEVTNISELTEEIKKAQKLNEELDQSLEIIRNFEPKIKFFSGGNFND